MEWRHMMSRGRRNTTYICEVSYETAKISIEMPEYVKLFKYTLRMEWHHVTLNDVTYVETHLTSAKWVFWAAKICIEMPEYEKTV